jgi:hypothetical protein
MAEGQRHGQRQMGAEFLDQKAAAKARPPMLVLRRSNRVLRQGIAAAKQGHKCRSRMFLCVARWLRMAGMGKTRTTRRPAQQSTSRQR